MRPERKVRLTPVAMADGRMLAACADVVSELSSLLGDGRAGAERSDWAQVVHAARTRAAKRHGLATQPRLADVVRAVPPGLRDALVPLLRTKPVRTASGVAVVAVMCAPHRCPHIAATGNICVYCPGGPDSDFEYSAQSYTGYEPTSMRAIRARYDAGVQARGRLAQLAALGHATDKVEFVVMGGTFMALPRAYRASFISALHDSLSGAQSAGDLSMAIAASDASPQKCVAITVETRPDYCQRTHVDDLLSYGATRLEIGVQSVYEDVARDTNRGHTVASVAATLRRTRDAGYKLVVHMMPDLPGVGWDRDVAQFRELFFSPAFRPDGAKVYPTLVIRGTGLYELWRTGRYRPAAPDRLISLLARVLAAVPPWTRVYRVQRDIPMPLVSAGVGSGNVRELVLARMAEAGWRCRDVRTREVGISAIHGRGRPVHVELVRRDYAAADGWETFLSFEDTVSDTLVGLLRLRRLPRAVDPSPAVPDHTRLSFCTLPPETDPLRNCDSDSALDAPSPEEIRPEVLAAPASIVRELHVYGTAVPVHSRDPARFQHQGYGAALMAEAERIAAEEHASTRLLVIAGVGTRAYYRRLGYALDGPYMAKALV